MDILFWINGGIISLSLESMNANQVICYNHPNHGALLQTGYSMCQIICKVPDIETILLLYTERI